MTRETTLCDIKSMTVEELAAALREKCPAFRASAPETCACGPLRFAAVPERAHLADPLPSADYLMKQMDSRLA